MNAFLSVYLKFLSRVLELLVFTHKMDLVMLINAETGSASESYKQKHNTQVEYVYTWIGFPEVRNSCFEVPPDFLC